MIPSMDILTASQVVMQYHVVTNHSSAPYATPEDALEAAEVAIRMGWAVHIFPTMVPASMAGK